MAVGEQEQALGEGLKGRLWKTRGSRFVARERLRATNTISITTVTMLSVYVVISSVVLLAFSDDLNDLNEKWLNVTNIGLSILIIVFSLIEASRDHLGAAETMSNSALAIGRIYGELSAKIDGRTLDVEGLLKMEADYADVLRESRLNHSTLDYFAFKLQKPKDFPEDSWIQNKLYRAAATVYIGIRNYWLYITALSAFPVLVAIFGSRLLAVA